MITILVKKDQERKTFENIEWALQTAKLEYEIAETEKRIEGKEFPQVCIGNLLCGGYYELTTLLDSGQLKSESWIRKAFENLENMKKGN